MSSRIAGGVRRLTREMTQQLKTELETNGIPSPERRSELARSMGVSIGQISSWFVRHRNCVPQTNTAAESEEMDDEPALTTHGNTRADPVPSAPAPPVHDLVPTQSPPPTVTPIQDVTLQASSSSRPDTIRSSTPLRNFVPVPPFPLTVSPIHDVPLQASSSVRPDPIRSVSASSAPLPNMAPAPPLPATLQPITNQAPRGILRQTHNAPPTPSNQAEPQPLLDPKQLAVVAASRVCSYGKSLSKEVVAPREILDSFGPEGLKDDDQEQITDIEEMVFQNVLRKKLICDICMTHMKRFRCSECFYAMCRECVTNLSKEFVHQEVPCPQCRKGHKHFVPVILPRF